MWTILPSLRVAVLNAECLDTRSRPLSLTTPLIWLARLNCDCIWLYCASRISCLPVQYGSHPLHLTVGLQPSNTKVPGGSWDRTSLTPSRLQSFGPSLSVIRKLSAVPSTKKNRSQWGLVVGRPCQALLPTNGKPISKNPSACFFFFFCLTTPPCQPNNIVACLIRTKREWTA